MFLLLDAVVREARGGGSAAAGGGDGDRAGGDGCAAALEISPGIGGGCISGCFGGGCCCISGIGGVGIGGVGIGMWTMLRTPIGVQFQL